MKAVKKKVYLNKKQETLFLESVDASRYVYNRCLALKKYAYQKFGVSLSAYTLIKRITVWKKRKNTEFLKKASIQNLQQAVLDMEKAYKNFFRRVKSGEKKAGFPRFKSRHYASQKVRYVQYVQLDWEKKKVYFPKVGWCKAKNWREDLKNFPHKSVSLERDRTGAFYASVLFHGDSEKVIPPFESFLGLDMGVRYFTVTSDSQKEKGPHIEPFMEKLDFLQKKLSQSEKKSKRREKKLKSLNQTWKKAIFLKQNYAHHLTKQLAEKHTKIFVEDLNIKAMSKSAAGTLEKPGVSVAAKSGLNREILKKGWGSFFQILDYKLQERGGSLEKVDPKFSSQDCSECGYRDKKNRKEEKFHCHSCGYEDHADVNAAKNLLKRGLNLDLDAKQTDKKALLSSLERSESVV